MLAHPAIRHRSAANRVAVVVVTNRLASVVRTVTNDTAMSTAAVARAVDGRVDSACGLRHSTPGSVRGIAGRTAPGGAVVSAPAGLTREHCAVEAVEGVGPSSVDEGRVADEGDVVDYQYSLGDDVRKGGYGRAYSESPKQQHTSYGTH
jgi:hypothetical protein